MEWKNPRGRTEQGALLALLALAACGYSNNGYSSGPKPPPPGLTVAKGAPSGDGQTATVGQPLTNPFRIVVTRGGVPEAGAEVSWQTATAGATLNPAVGTTDATGSASTLLTLSRGAGAEVVQANVTGGGSVSFTATARADAATTIALLTTGDISGTVNTVFGQPLQASVKDQFGNPVAGVTVTWRVASGAATLTPATSITNAQGVATTALTFGGVVGPIQIQASSAGLTGSPASISATATVPGRIVGVKLLSSGGNHFDPASVVVAAGTTIRFTWVSGFHNVTSTGTPAFATNEDSFNAGHIADVAFPTPGTYRYFCSEHGTPTSGMRGTIVVQ